MLHLIAGFRGSLKVSLVKNEMVMSLSLVEQLWETISLESLVHSEPALYFGVYRVNGLLLYFLQGHTLLKLGHDTNHQKVKMQM